jgi:predicted phosphoribosyltransferase
MQRFFPAVNQIYHALKQIGKSECAATLNSENWAEVHMV